MVLTEVVRRVPVHSKKIVRGVLENRSWVMVQDCTEGVQIHEKYGRGVRTMGKRQKKSNPTIL